jgi:choline-sulfatase
MPWRSRVLLLLIFLPNLAFAAKPNIILITISSNRASNATPAVTTLSRSSLTFDQAFAQSPETVASTATILTGTYPQTHQAGELGSPLVLSLPYVPDILRLRGYRSAAFVGTIAFDPKRGSAPGFGRGFFTYDAGFHLLTNESRFAATERRASEVVARASTWITKNSQSPFFLWIQLDDARATTGAPYAAAIAACDSAVEKLIAALRSQKLLDDALIVVTADHGQSLGAHGEDTHGVFLYDETIHVPLLLKLPQNQNAGKHVQGRVGLVDIAPTVLEVAGVPVPPQMQGQSLLRQAKAVGDRPAYSRSDLPQRAFGWSPLESWRAGKYLYVRAPKPELYDLSSDPAAKKNLAQSSKATLDTIAAQLNAFDSHFGAQGTRSSELTSTEMQKLASLGYVGLQKSASKTGTAATGIDPKDGIDAANKVFSAAALLNDGKPERAVASLQQSMSALSNSYLAQYTLGAALAQQRQYAAAIEHLHKAIELQPESFWAHYQMGLSLLKTSDYKTAAVHLEIAATRVPDFADTHTLLARAYDHLGRTEDAKRERSKAPLVGKQ